VLIQTIENNRNIAFILYGLSVISKALFLTISPGPFIKLDALFYVFNFIFFIKTKL